MTLIDPRPNREQPSKHWESLPLPVVYYGGLYSTFIRFAENESSESFLCECSRSAAINQIWDTISHLGGPSPWSIASLGNLLDHRPQDYQRDGPGCRFSIADEVIPLLQFRPGLCHLCNHAVPSIDYGYELCCRKASFFVRRFGFYVQQWLLSQGLTGWGSQIVNVPLSGTVQPLLEIDTIEARKKIFSVPYHGFGVEPATWLENRALRNALRTQNERVCDFAEAQVRELFRFPAKGRLAQAEHLLLFIFRRIYGSENVIHRSRPAWLAGLELDVHVPSLGMAAEYQGHQHSSARSFLHSNDPCRFKATQARDARKIDLCQINGTALYYFDERDYLTEELVRKRIGLSNS